MQSGILRIGDVVKYSASAQRTLRNTSDNKEHIVESISKNVGGDEIVYFKGERKYGTATSWLKLVRKWKSKN